MKLLVERKEDTIKELKSMMAKMESRSVQHELRVQTVDEKLKQHEVQLLPLHQSRTEKLFCHRGPPGTPKTADC